MASIKSSSCRVLAGYALSSPTDWFDEAFLKHYGRIYALLHRLVGVLEETEDLAQEVFLRLYQNPPKARSEDDVAGWLYRVATNLGLNALRSRYRERRWWERMAGVFKGTMAVAQENDLSETAVRSETGARVRTALRQLPRRQKAVLALRQAGFSYGEIAQVIGVSHKSVGTLLVRAERGFRERYQALCGQEDEP